MKQISKSLCITSALLIWVGAAMGAPTQLLLNPGFEGTSGPDNWTKSSGVDWLSSGGVSGAYVRNISMWDGDIGTIEQTVSIAPGYHNLALSFWARVTDNGAWPSVAAGELIVDGNVVASANKVNCGWSTSSYQQVWATWAGEVAAGTVTVRFTLVADGTGGEDNTGNARLDDAELFDCGASGCPTQHDVTNIEPNVINTPVSTDTPVTITGTGLTNVTGVHLYKTFVGPWHDNPTNDVVIAGTIDTVNRTDTSMPVTFATSDAAAGVFDLVVENSGANPVVISNAFEILDPSALHNLLANPSFEVVKIDPTTADPTSPQDAVGNAAMWFGDYIKNPAANPSPTSHDYQTDYFGYYGIWSISAGTSGEQKSARMWQTVPVTPGSTVTFSGWLDVNARGTLGSNGVVAVTLHDGDETGPVIGTVQQVDQTTPGAGGTDGTWVSVGTSGTANSGSVTVELTATIECIGGGGNEVGAFADDFTLTVSPASAGPLHPWIAYPTTGYTGTNPRLVITGGSNLDEATAIKLVFVDGIAQGDQTETVVYGTVVPALSNPTRLVVDFPMYTELARENLYNLVLEKPNAPPANLGQHRIRRGNGVQGADGAPNCWRYYPNTPPTFVDLFSLICSNPVTFDAVDPAAIVTREALRQLRITGDNVTVLADPVNVVKLVQGATELVGTDPMVDGDDLLVTFDFTSAPSGFYELVAERGDQCSNPAALARAVRYSPPGSQLLPNGDFELEGPKGGDATPVAFWTSYLTAVPVRYNNQTWYPVPATQGGANRAGISEGGTAGSTQRVIQTVPVQPRYQITLTGWIYGGATSGQGRALHDHQVLIRDGGPEDAIIGQFSVTDPANVWTPFTITTAPTGSQVTVEWGHVLNTSGSVVTVATHVDELLLVQSAAPCTFPVMFDTDADGDVDQTDFALFQSCYTGAGGTLPEEPEYCVCFDVDGSGGDPDNDVDQADLNRFELCASGPGVPLNPDCINP